MESIHLSQCNAARWERDWMIGVPSGRVGGQGARDLTWADGIDIRHHQSHLDIP